MSAHVTQKLKCILNLSAQYLENDLLKIALHLLVFPLFRIIKVKWDYVRSCRAWFKFKLVILFLGHVHALFITVCFLKVLYFGENRISL